MLEHFPNIEEFRNERMKIYNDHLLKISDILNNDKPITSEDIEKLYKIDNNYKEINEQIEYYKILYISLYGNDGNLEYDKNIIDDTIEFFKNREEFENCKSILDLKINMDKYDKDS